MKATIESTLKMTEINGIPARAWAGKTESGIPVMALITRIAPLVDRDAPEQAEFQRELQETRAPFAEIKAIPLRMIL